LAVGESFTTWKKWRRRVLSIAWHINLPTTTRAINANQIKVWRVSEWPGSGHPNNAMKDGVPAAGINPAPGGWGFEETPG